MYFDTAAFGSRHVINKLSPNIADGEVVDEDDGTKGKKKRTSDFALWKR